jgi:glycosyltransferase involved in cell wall biosynthesis
MNRRVHLLSTPNVQPIAADYLDVFSGFTRRFAELLTELGYEVFLYGSEETDAPCAQLVTCISKADQAKFLGDVPAHKAWYDGQNPLFVHFNVRAAAGIQARKEPGDTIATIAGTAQAAIWQQHADCRFLEYSIGYRGVCAPYRVYQSHAWRCVAHGFTGMEYGRQTDDVIYHWFHEDEFPVRPVEDYVLYVGRIVSVKGLRTACAAAERAGVKLYLIGDGDPSLITYGEYLGHMPPSERNRWMAGARALLAPTEYIEPSACVATEAQLCGTPVIATNWGGFPEYVEDRKTGYLCTGVDEFVQGIQQIDRLDRDYTRCRAREKFGWAAGVEAYRRYFARVATTEAVGTQPALTEQTS